MRIALLTAEYPPTPGGVGDYTACLGAALARQGADPRVWTIRDGRLWEFDIQGRQADQVLGVAAWDWRCWGALQSAIGRGRPAVLHIQYQTGAYGMHPAINLLPWRLRGAAGRPRILVTAHDLLMPYLFPKAGPLRTWVTRRLFGDADAMIVTNDADLQAATAGQYQAAAGAPSFSGRLRRAPHLIPIGSNITPDPPPGYERGAWRARLGIGVDETLVAFFGLISPTKGLDTLLDALERLPQSVRVLVIGGEAPAPQDRSYAQGLRERVARQFSDRVMITGHCTPQEVSGHLLAADLAALPFADGATFRRGSLLAALAHGVPVITTQDPRNPEPQNQEPRTAEPGTQNPVPSSDTRQGDKQTRRRSLSNLQLPSSNNQPPATSHQRTNQLPTLEHGANAWLIAPGDAGALALAVTMVAGDAGLRLRLCQGGLVTAAQFSWDAIAVRHLQLYRELLHTS